MARRLHSLKPLHARGCMTCSFFYKHMGKRHLRIIKVNTEAKYRILEVHAAPFPTGSAKYGNGASGEQGGAGTAFSECVRVRVCSVCVCQGVL